MKMVTLITTRIEASIEVGLAWQDAGAPGVTVIQSHGLYTLREKTKGGSIELPLHVTSMASAMAYVSSAMEHTTQVVLSVVPDELADKLVAIANDKLGGLLSPRVGIVFVVDVEQAIGLRAPGEDDS